MAWGYPLSVVKNPRGRRFRVSHKKQVAKNRKQAQNFNSMSVSGVSKFFTGVPVLSNGPGVYRRSKPAFGYAVAGHTK